MEVVQWIETKDKSDVMLIFRYFFKSWQSAEKSIMYCILSIITLLLLSFQQWDEKIYIMPG